MKKQNIGSSFDSFLKKEGIYEEVVANAEKKVKEFKDSKK